MECKKCGSNLDMETPFCPYCGTENPFFKKHREDMDKYDKDYKKTKEDVLTSQKTYIKKSFRIATISITVAMTVFVILICIFNESIGWDLSYKRTENASYKYEDEIRSYMASRDYFALYQLIEKNGIVIYKIPSMKDDSNLSFATRDYCTAFANVLVISTSSKEELSQGSYVINSLVRNIRAIYEYADSQRGSEETKSYINDIKRDLGLLLETELSFSKEEVLSIPDISDATLALMIEERIDADR